MSSNRRPGVDEAHGGALCVNMWCGCVGNGVWVSLKRMEAPPAVGTAAQGAEAGDEEAPVWRLASGSSASDDEASRIFFFFLSSAHATLILEASEFPLWFHHIWALAPTSAMKAASPLAWSSFTTPDAPGAAKRMQSRLQVAVPMVFFTCLVQRGCALGVVEINQELGL